MISSTSHRINQFGLALPIMCAIIYLVLGFGWDLWSTAWVVFLLIPAYYVVLSMLPVDGSVRSHIFPTLIFLGYMVIGFLGWWHPGWILMMLIPIYYIFTASPEELEAGRRDRADTL